MEYEISPGYLNAFRIPLLRGRNFTSDDEAGAPPVAMINEAAARKFWPNRDPLGQQIVIGKEDGLPDPARSIVGVVGNTHASGLSRAPGPMIFVPVGQVGDAMAAVTMKSVPGRWVVRTHGDPHSYVSAVTEQLRVASGGFSVGNVRTMEQETGRSTARQSFNMLLRSIFGAMALILAAIGIYGPMAYSAAQRLQEMGIRMVLGADASSIRNLVVWQGTRLTLVGLGGGSDSSLRIVEIHRKLPVRCRSLGSSRVCRCADCARWRGAVSSVAAHHTRVTGGPRRRASPTVAASGRRFQVSFKKGREKPMLTHVEPTVGTP